MNRINNVCRAIRKITVDELDEMGRIANEQVTYCHPLRYAKAASINRLGEYNQKVVTKLRELHAIISSFQDSAKTP